MLIVHPLVLSAFFCPFVFFSSADRMHCSSRSEGFGPVVLGRNPKYSEARLLTYPESQVSSPKVT